MKQLSYLMILNIVGIVFSILYGVYGGSGGDTTSKVFFGIAFTGVLTLVLCLILACVKIDLFKKKWFWFIVLIITGFLEASIINWRVFFGL